MKQNNNYNSQLQPIAHKLRKSMTKAEASIWKYILKGKKLGVIFRRQRPIGKYVVDFICLELKLIIEVDGESHNHPEIYENDLIRQRYLENLGFTVLRFTDEEVLKSINSITPILEDFIKSKILL
jgi:very-short-patch-repair endonuclease